MVQGVMLTYCDFVPFTSNSTNFNRGFLVVKSKLWYKVRFIFVKNTHVYRHVW
ncbi:MAG: hypothetical protein RLZZ419_494 [Pseudomonadota bacterium]|jgi:hypothetical protein